MRGFLVAVVMTLAGCRCGESTSGPPPKATEEELIEAATKALCETSLAQDIEPFVKEPDSQETTDKWRRVFFLHEDDLGAFAGAAHFANDEEAKARLVRKTAIEVWMRCASHLSAQWDQNDNIEVERLIHHAVTNKWPRK